MTEYDIDRRRFLELLGCTAAVGTAGCLESGGSDSPAPTDWAPAGADGLTFGYLTLDITETTETDSGAVLQPLPVTYPHSLAETGEERRVRYADETLKNPDDPLLALPVQTGGVLILGIAIALGIPGLGYLADPESDATVRDVLRIDETVLALGDIDVERAQSNLEAGGSGPHLGQSYEETEEYGEFRLYEPTEAVDGDAPGIVAVSPSAALVAGTRDTAVTVIDTAGGDHERAIEESKRFAWLRDAVGDGDLMVGWYGSVDVDGLQFDESGDEMLHDVFRGSDDVLGTLTFAPDENEVTAEIALRNDDLTQRGDRLQEALGTAADEQSLTVEDDRVTGTATYEDITFEPADPESEDEPPTGDDVPEEVAEAVPEDAFSFEYDEEQAAVRVEIAKSFEADEIKAEAVNTDSEVAIEGTEMRSGSWVNIYVDPDGDTVRVIVTVDGVSGVVATRDVPPE
jgi:hypothetical protein